MNNKTIMGREELAKYQPGDKLYKLFEHKQVIVEGKEEEFLVKIEKIK